MLHSKPSIISMLQDKEFHVSVHPSLDPTDVYLHLFMSVLLFNTNINLADKLCVPCLSY